MTITAPNGSSTQIKDVVRQANTEFNDTVENPKKPRRLPKFDLAKLPAASQFKNCIALLDTGEEISSDGAIWRLYDGTELSSDPSRPSGALQIAEDGADVVKPYLFHRNVKWAYSIDPVLGSAAATSRTALDAALSSDFPVYFPKAVYDFTGASQGGTNGLNVYNLTTDRKPFRLSVSPEATFPGSVPSFQLSLPYQGYVFGFEGIARRYEPGEFAGASSLNVFQTFSYCEVARPRSGGPGVVAVYGQGNGVVSGALGWGANFVASASVDGAGGIGIEINTVNVGGNTGNVNALVIKSSGTFFSGTVLSIAAGSSASAYQDGIVFDTVSLVPAATAIKFGVSTITNIVYAESMKATGSEMFLPSFRVGTTSLTGGTRVDLLPGANPEFRIIATGAAGATPATNASLIFRGLGTGGAFCRAGDGATKVQWNTTGVAFQGTSPIAKPTLPAAATDLPTAITLLNNVRAALINYGLCS